MSDVKEEPVPQNRRQAKAREAANGYAPMPNGSSILYGLIAVTLMGMAIIIVSIFYQADMGAFSILIGIALASAFVAGVLLRKRRRRQHGVAYAEEYARHTNGPPAAVRARDEV